MVSELNTESETLETNAFMLLNPFLKDSPMASNSN